MGFWHWTTLILLAVMLWQNRARVQAAVERIAGWVGDWRRRG